MQYQTHPPPPPGIDYRLGFFPGDLGKIGELFVNNSFSVEQVISYFAVTGVSKQILLFALIIFHLYGRLNAFFMAYAIGFFHTVVIGSCIDFRFTCLTLNEKMKVHMVFSLNVIGSFADDIIHVVSSVTYRLYG